MNLDVLTITLLVEVALFALWRLRAIDYCRTLREEPVRSNGM